MIAQTSDKTRKYRVRRAHGAWRVESAETCLGVFADPDQAVEMACRSARADADHGRVAIVTTETTPQEFHCYAPPEGQSVTPAPSAPPHLRLVSS